MAPAIVCASVSHNGNQTMLTVETASQILCYISLGLIFESANKAFFHKSDKKKKIKKKLYIIFFNLFLT